MDYDALSATENTTLEIKRNCIEYNKTTIQIANIVTTSVSSIILPFDEPEPKFEESSPNLSFTSIFFALLSSIIIWFVIDIYEFRITAYAASIITSISTIYLILSKYTTLHDEWESRKLKIQEQWNIWSYLKTNPPVVYELSITTNAAIEPFNFFSYHKDEIESINNSIKKSIENLVLNSIDSQTYAEKLHALQLDINNLSATTKSMYKKILERPTMNINIGNNNSGITIGDNNINQIQKQSSKTKKEIPLKDLASDLKILINEIQKNPENPESWAAIGPLKAAEMSAEQNKKEDAYKYLKSAGKFSLSVAEKLGLPLALEALRIALTS